jgi:hypothetical protein
MPRIRKGQTNFTAGELSPLIAARADTAVYQNGAATLRNVRVLYQGGARTRFGTRWLANLPQSPAKLAEFVFNRSQAYVVAFSNGRADIHDENGALITTLSGAPWTTAMLARLNWAQLGDTMIVVHPDLEMQIIKRVGPSSFTRAPLAFESPASGIPRYQPYFKFAEPSMTLTPSGTTGAITLTLSGAGAWTALHVNTIVRYKKKEILVTGFTSATVASGTVRETLAAATADPDWDEQVFSPARGFANSVVFFADRLWFGGSRGHPVGLWGSKTGAYFNFDVGTGLDNEAIWESVVGSRLSEIRHLQDFRHLLVYADRALFYVPASPSTPITPKNIAIIEQQPYGASNTRPQSFDGASVYIQETGRIAREGYWVDTDQAYRADAVSAVAEHLINGPTEVAATYGDTGRVESYLMLVNGDGSLVVFHSVRQEKMAAWTQWTTNGTFKAICSTGQKVFVAVERMVAGSPVLMLERFEEGVAPLDASAIAVSASPTKTFTGFSHLAGATVDISSKGHYLGQHLVAAGGTITLGPNDPQVTEIEAGLGFEQRIKPLPIDFDLADGPARGLMKRLVRALLVLDRAGGFSVQGRDVLLDFAGDDFSSTAPTKTGIAEVRLLGIDQNCQFDVVVDKPIAVTVLGIVREVHVNA